MGEMFDILGKNGAFIVEEFAAPYLDREYVEGGRWTARPGGRALMPPGKERSEDLVEHDILAKEDLADFVADGGNASDRLFKRRRDCGRGVGFHVGWLVHVRRAMAIFCKS